MLKNWISVCTAAGAFLAASALPPPQPAPAVTPGLATTDQDVTLVRRGGGGGFSMRGGGGPRIGKFGGGGGPKFFGGGGGPRFSHRGSPGFKGHHGRRFTGDWKHRHRGHKHRRSRKFVLYGAPYVYGWYGGY